jgi:hypothetical protein
LKVKVKEEAAAAVPTTDAKRVAFMMSINFQAKRIES